MVVARTVCRKKRNLLGWDKEEAFVVRVLGEREREGDAILFDGRKQQNKTNDGTIQHSPSTGPTLLREEVKPVPFGFFQSYITRITWMPVRDVQYPVAPETRVSHAFFEEYS